MFLWTILLVIDKHNRMILPRFVELLVMRINSIIWKDINCVLPTVGFVVDSVTLGVTFLQRLSIYFADVSPL